MRRVLSMIMIAGSIAVSSAHPESDFEQMRFGDNMIYAGYNGFVRGLYRSS